MIQWAHEETAQEFLKGIRFRAKDERRDPGGPSYSAIQVPSDSAPSISKSSSATL